MTEAHAAVFAEWFCASRDRAWEFMSRNCRFSNSISLPKDFLFLQKFSRRARAQRLEQLELTFPPPAGSGCSRPLALTPFFRRPMKPTPRLSWYRPAEIIPPLSHTRVGINFIMGTSLLMLPNDLLPVFVLLPWFLYMNRLPRQGFSGRALRGPHAQRDENPPTKRFFSLLFPFSNSHPPIGTTMNSQELQNAVTVKVGFEPTGLFPAWNAIDGPLATIFSHCFCLGHLGAGGLR